MYNSLCGLILLKFAFPQVEGLKLSALQRNSLCSCSLPSHPLLQQTTGSSSIPNHPLLHSTSPPPNSHDCLEACSCTCRSLKHCETTRLPLSANGGGIHGDATCPAAANIGYSEATGLSLLVERCLGKPLDKSQQLSDWERRPLKETQVRYAGECTKQAILLSVVHS